MDKRALFFVIVLTCIFYFVNQFLFPSKVAQKPATETQTSAVEEVIPLSELTYESATTGTQQGAQAEQFYVLENGFQQLVFSSAGGAISEINLTLQSKQNPQSVVRAIQFDKTIQQDFASNDHFPAHPYQINDGVSIQKKEMGQLGGYYPLLRRTLIGPRGDVIKKFPSQFYALNTVTDERGQESPLYRLSRFEKDLIEFQLDAPNRKITKTYSFPKDQANTPYCVEVSIRVDGDARGLWLNSGIPEVELISGDPAPSIKYLTTKSNGKTQVEQLSLPKTVTTFASIHPSWVSNSNGFFGLILNPTTEIGAGFKALQIDGGSVPSRLTLIDIEYSRFPPDKYPGYQAMVPLRAGTMKFRVYAGPFEDDILKQVDESYLDSATGKTPQFIGAMSFHGWFTFISEPFAKFLFILMKFFYMITSSWGVSIILLTVALRVMLYPLNAWSIKSTLKMQQVAPKVSQIQEKHKKDPKRAQMEIMNLYRERGVNPLTGCFPLLIQLPFLIGMFDLLKSTFELRGATFIPYWIDNLTAPDVVFSWNYPIIFFGNSFHLLPFILGAVMWIQQRMSASVPKDPKMMTDQQKQQRMMGNVMTVVFTVMFYHFPSGLNMYWLSSMGLGILQQWWTNRKMTPPSKEIVIGK